MESLQIAQVLADLSDLQNTDATAATNLLAANRTLPSLTRKKSQSQAQSEPARFDRLGRRIVGPVRSSASTPVSLSREASSASAGGSVAGSGTGTPRSGVEADVDITRARTLLELFEKRANFKQMGDTGLQKSKERVDAVVASYAKKDLELKERNARSRYLSPRA